MVSTTNINWQGIYNKYPATCLNMINFFREGEKLEEASYDQFMNDIVLIGIFQNPEISFHFFDKKILIGVYPETDMVDDDKGGEVSYQIFFKAFALSNYSGSACSDFKFRHEAVCWVVNNAFEVYNFVDVDMIEEVNKREDD